ncbi:hypothetical protein, partial [Acidilobus sp.]|uniref:hypothetical protein n=1 Tax=Acidilobus sp. TaxID=1872109 RepID=UPI003CFD3860
DGKMEILTVYSLDAPVNPTDRSSALPPLLRVAREQELREALKRSLKDFYYFLRDYWPQKPDEYAVRMISMTWIMDYIIEEAKGSGELVNAEYQC